MPTKGSSGKFSSDKVVGFIREARDHDNKIILKNDQGPSMQYLIKDIISEREEGRTIIEESPVKSSGSNGVVERSVWDIEAQVRAAYLALEGRMKRRVDARERIITFIPEYVAFLMNRIEAGQDSKANYERVKGKRPNVPGVEFGEKLLYKVRLASRMEKIDARWEYGIVVGARQKQ